jgi:hypothetical protein
MLNRTNLTLSALALSNRLNLGTRSFAANASVNFVGETLRTRQSHHDVMRERMDWYVVLSMPRPRYAIPVIRSSFFQPQHGQLSCVTSQQSVLAVDVCVDSAPRPADLVSRRERGVQIRDPRFQPSNSLVGMARSDAAGCKSRSAVKPTGKRGLKRTAAPAARAAAAAAMLPPYGK